MKFPTTRICRLSTLVLNLTLLLTTATVRAQPGYEDVNAPLIPMFFGDIAWGDVDSDGDLDLVIAGYKGPEGTNSNSYDAKVYKNIENVFVESSQIFHVPSQGVQLEWGDYDNDGDLDLVFNGSFTTLSPLSLYRNNGSGTFTQIILSISETRQGCAAWGDFDNDGDLDLLIAGSRSNAIGLAEIYRNDGNDTFISIDAGLNEVRVGSCSWADYDIDGDLDLVIMGLIGFQGEKATRLYINQGNSSFVNSQIEFMGFAFGSSAWGDYDSDGDPDLLLNGQSNEKDADTRLYRNDGDNTFVELDAGLLPTVNGTAYWGDHDNDGDLDILINGEDTGKGFTRIYDNRDTAFVDAAVDLHGVTGGTAKFGDYDRDGDLDIALMGADTTGTFITKIYKSTLSMANTRPQAPDSLWAVVDKDSVTMNWLRATDAETPSAGLTYSVRLGTSSAGSQVISAMIDTKTDHNSRPKFGNVGHRTSRSIGKLALGTHYWSVHTVDNGFATSHSGEETFKISTALLDANDGNRAIVVFESGSFDGAELSFESYGTRRPEDVPVPPSFFSTLPRYFSVTANMPDTNAFVATVSLEYTEEVTTIVGEENEAMLTVASYDTTSSMWVLHEAVVDTVTNTITFEVSEFLVWALGTVTPTAIADEIEGDVPNNYTLGQNHPNPFNPETFIHYSLPQAGAARLVVYNLLGQEVRVLVDDVQPAGHYRTVWDGQNSQGQHVSSGVYVYRLTAGNFRQGNKMVFLK